LIREEPDPLRRDFGYARVVATWVLDESRPPVVVLRLDDPSGREAPDFESMLTAMGQLRTLHPGRRLYVVLDLTGARPDAQRRQRLVDWLKREGATVRPRVAAFAIVAPSAFLRGALTAVRWFFPERMMHSEMFETRASALEWIERLAR
jgi:hypothetical protein